MRENPLPNSTDDFKSFKGDSVFTNTGETKSLLEQEAFAWDTVIKKGTELNTSALPTGTEKIYKQIKENQD